MGRFVAVDLGGEIWVGTEREWTNVIADNVARDSGMKAVHIAGQGRNERTYVDAKLGSTTVGTSHLYGISTSIVFGVPASKALKRPPKPKGAEYVSIVWTPSDSAPTRAIIYESGATITPNECATVPAFRYCEFTASKAQMTVPADLVFLIKDAKPGAIHVESLAKRSYADIVIKNRSTGGDPISGDDASDLKSLHEIDQSIPSLIEPKR